jgi:maleate isomerase
MDQVQAAMPDTIARVMTCKPTNLALGMTAVAFLGGRNGEAALIERLVGMAGVPVTSGPASIAAALERFGTRRVAVLSPYQPIAEDHVAKYFADIGQEIVRSASLRSMTATSIAEVSFEETRRLVREIDGPDVDAIVQLGTNLAMMSLVGELEAETGKPVIPINGATVWAAMRASGIDDRIEGFGSLLANH